MMRTVTEIPIHWIIQRIPIAIGITTCEQDRILGGALPRLGLIAPDPEAGELGVSIVKTARKAEGLEARVGIQEAAANH